MTYREFINTLVGGRHIRGTTWARTTISLNQSPREQKRLGVFFFFFLCYENYSKRWYFFSIFFFFFPTPIFQTLEKQKVVYTFYYCRQFSIVLLFFLFHIFFDSSDIINL